MGANAIGAANSLSGEFKGVSATGSSRVEAFCNMGKNVLTVKRFRRVFKDERHRLTRLKPQSVAKRALRQEVLVQILLMSLMKEKTMGKRRTSATLGKCVRLGHCERKKATRAERPKEG